MFERVECKTTFLRDLQMCFVALLEETCTHSTSLDTQRDMKMSSVVGEIYHIIYNSEQCEKILQELFRCESIYSE